jgi:hypothetical protein
LIMEPGVNQSAPAFSRIISEPMAPHGTSKQYLVERLRRENQTALLAAVEAGEISALSAAVSLGWIQRPPVVGKYPHREKQRQHRLRAITGEGLSPAAWQELWLGPCGTTSVFNSRQELESAWQWARERMMASLSPGRRPQAFYEFEYTGTRPPYDTERSTLWRKGLLTVEERATLEREWRAAFTEADAPDFTVNDGSGEILTGDCARAAHYAHHDIPAALVKRWQAARRRRERRSAPLEEVAAATE